MELVTATALRIHGWPGIASLRPAADRASRSPLNGFARAFAEVRHHRIGGSRRRMSDASPTGLSDTAKAGMLGYPRYNPGVGEGLRPFKPRKARAPTPRAVPERANDMGGRCALWPSGDAHRPFR